MIFAAGGYGGGPSASSIAERVLDLQEERKTPCGFLKWKLEDILKYSCLTFKTILVKNRYYSRENYRNFGALQKGTEDFKTMMQQNIDSIIKEMMNLFLERKENIEEVEKYLGSITEEYTEFQKELFFDLDKVETNSENNYFSVLIYGIIGLGMGILLRIFDSETSYPMIFSLYGCSLIGGILDKRTKEEHNRSELFDKHKEKYPVYIYKAIEILEHKI